MLWRATVRLYLTLKAKAMENFTTSPTTITIDAAAIQDEFETSIAEPAQTDETEDNANEFEKIGFTYRELIELELPPREEIIFGLGRGEVGFLNAVNNAGKTTLLRNLMISLGIGKPFPPFGNFSLPKRVAFWTLKIRCLIFAKI